MTIREYLSNKGVEYFERGGQLWTNCLFNDCDADSRPNEHHLSFEAETGQYHCKKCDARGNLMTLMQHFGDKTEHKKRTSQPAIETIAKKCHRNLTLDVREYLTNERGLPDWAVESAQLGYGEFYGHSWITIPIQAAGGVTALKLRKLPSDDANDNKYMWYPGQTATLFNGDALLAEKSEDVLICEGELDAIMALSHGLHTAVSSTAGAGTFKEEWLPYFKYVKTVWICYDRDEQGEAGVERIVELFNRRCPDITVMNVNLPDKVGDKGDLTDYFKLPNASPDRLFSELAHHIGGPEPIDTSQFKELAIDELTTVLGQTIRNDDANKAILFLACLTAYTEQDQLNVYLNGPSSSGKTYLATEVAKYFPTEDVEEYGSASPTSFIHRKPKIDPVTGESYVDCERKILLFLELPHHKLQANLRPLLSHDKKEIVYLTTDKNKRGGNDTKESRLRGFPATIFCSASTKMDEQEATRAILLSPEISKEKMTAGVRMAALKGADPVAFDKKIEADPDRRSLKCRIRAIKRLRS